MCDYIGPFCLVCWLCCRVTCYVRYGGVGVSCMDVCNVRFAALSVSMCVLVLCCRVGF